MPTFDRNWLNRFLRRPPYVAGLLLAMFAVYFQPAAAQEASRKVIARTAPSYPELARRMHLAGKVRLEVIITTGGSVKAAHLVGGNPVFENNAIEAVKQWRFEAASTETKAIVVLEFAGQ